MIKFILIQSLSGKNTLIVFYSSNYTGKLCHYERLMFMLETLKPCRKDTWKVSLIWFSSAEILLSFKNVLGYSYIISLIPFLTPNSSMYIPKYTKHSVSMSAVVREREKYPTSSSDLLVYSHTCIHCTCVRNICSWVK